ncbi:MAG: oligosaccharide flippase family protein [Candidatus Amoebophilus sp.]
MHQDTKIFLANFFQLSFLRGISRILPLITTPFLIRVIGIEKFGTLEFAKAISFYFTTFVSYGFRYSATKQVSLYKQDKNIIGQIVSSVYVLKLLIIVICFLIMIMLIVFVPKIREESIYLLCFFPVVIASSLFPTFAFQGLDKMHWLTSLNLISKVLFMASLFIFIGKPSDAFLFPILLAAVDILRLLVAFFVLYGSLTIPVRWPVWSIMKQQMKEGLHIFLSELAIMFYSRFPTIFLKFVGGSTVVAIYTLGDKIARVTAGMLEPFMQALYPIAYQKITSNLKAGIQYLKYLAKNSLIVLGVIGIVYWLFADKIIWLLADTNLPEAVEVFKIHAFLPAIVFLSKLLGIGILIPLQAGRKYTLSILLTGLIAVGLHFILVPLFQVKGAAWAIFLSEVFAVIFTCLATYKEINIFKVNNQLKY